MGKQRSFNFRKAQDEVAEARAWKCASCSKMLEEHDDKYCWQCADHWESVKNGLFDKWDQDYD